MILLRFWSISASRSISRAAKDQGKSSMIRIKRLSIMSSRPVSQAESTRCLWESLWILKMGNCSRGF